MGKLEVIKAAYGEHWETVKDFVDENGWCKARRKVNFTKIQKLVLEYNKFESYKYRPKSLQGIETNNGWISIDKNNLPVEKTSCYFITKEENDYLGTYHPILSEFRTANLCFDIDFVTHYQPITKPLPPLF